MTFLFESDHAFEHDGESPYCRRCNLLRVMHAAKDEPGQDITREDRG